jgi:hypothetical protein
MIGIVVHRHKGRPTLEALGKAVKDMRADVRKQHDDIRNNGKVSYVEDNVVLFSSHLPSGAERDGAVSGVGRVEADCYAEQVYKTMIAFVDEYKGPAGGKEQVCAVRRTRSARDTAVRQ